MDRKVVRGKCGSNENGRQEGGEEKKKVGSREGNKFSMLSNESKRGRSEPWETPSCGTKTGNFALDIGREKCVLARGSCCGGRCGETGRDSW